MLCEITYDFNLEDLPWVLVLFQIGRLLIVDLDEFEAPQRLPGVCSMYKEERGACHGENSTALLLKFNAPDKVAIVPLVNMRHLIDPVYYLFMLNYAHLKIDALLLLPILLLIKLVPPLT